MFYCWDETWALLIDECFKFKVSDWLESRTPATLLSSIMRVWVRIFGPMLILVVDQEGGMVSDMAGRFCDRLSVRRVFAGTDDHTVTGLVERHIMLTRISALKLYEEAKRAGLEVTKQDIMYEATMCQNLVLSYDGGSPAQGVLGYMPRDYYNLDASTLESHMSSRETSPDPFETSVRLRLMAKECVLK